MPMCTIHHYIRCYYRHSRPIVVRCKMHGIIVLFNTTCSLEKIFILLLAVLPQQNFFTASLLASAEFEGTDGTESPAATTTSLLLDFLKTVVIPIIQLEGN